MSLLYDASLIITPNAYKESKLYALKPQSGNGDLTWTRNSGATRVNSAGLIENVLANVPRLDYSLGGCPNILVEPHRTNRLLNSETLVTQSLSTTGLACAVSFYGTGTITFSGTFTGTLVGTGANNRVSTVFTPTTGTLTLTVSGSVTKAQLEVGAYPTSYIPTVASTVTRVADTTSKTGISSLLNPSEGTFLIESSALANDLTPRYIGLSDGTDNNMAVISYQGSNQIQFDIRVMTSYFRNTVTVDDITLNKKILLTWKDNSIFAFINGVKYTLTLVAGSGNGIPTALNRIDFGLYWGLPFYSKTKLVAVWKTQLTDTQCIQLTTL